MQVSFCGKTILISGATGHLGKQLIKDYYLSGATGLILLDIPDRKQELEEIAEEYAEKTKISIYTADFRNIEDIDRVIYDMAAKNIEVDVLINNAGLNVLRKPEETDELV
jgi:Short-chain dehydrogenases of various substrate specificities